MRMAYYFHRLVLGVSTHLLEVVFLIDNLTTRPATRKSLIKRVNGVETEGIGSQKVYI